MVMKVEKVIGSLPETLDTNTVYLVRAGTGFDLRVSDLTGATAHSLNSAPTWEYFVANWSVAPSQVGSTPAGSVWAYELNGVTRYRLVPTTYDPAQDGFYTTFAGGVLSGLITTRG